jgi:hypothetical protein
MLHIPPAPSVAPSVSPSASPSTDVPTVCMQGGEQCSSRTDCCGDGICFQTCVVRKVLAVDAGVDNTSRYEFKIAQPTQSSRLKRPSKDQSQF